MRSVRFVPLAILLSACVTDYAVAERIEPEPDPEEAPEAEPLPDTPEEVPEDTGGLEDTAPPVVEDDPAPADDCVGTSDLVYLVSRSDDGLYLFDPTTLTTQHLGTLDCSPWGDPQSMAVARNGVGYVRWSDDSIYEVDLDTLDCSPTSYQPGAFGAFGMGFATDHAGTWRDQLYVANFHRLAQLSTTTWSRTVLGATPSQVELTGNAVGELWAFAPLEFPALLVRLDKQTGEAQEARQLPGFPSPFDIDAFAFAQWGGDFYLFVRTYGVGNSSDVYRVAPSGQMTRVVTRMGIDVVGAGASTCAPAW